MLEGIGIFLCYVVQCAEVTDGAILVVFLLNEDNGTIPWGFAWPNKFILNHILDLRVDYVFSCKGESLRFDFNR